MQTLLEICQKYNTDKYYRPNGVDWNPRITNGAGHCYVEQIYDKHFSKRRDSARAVLEIGTYYGGSAAAWNEYFASAKVFTADVNYCENLRGTPQIIQLIGDAYEQSFIDSLQNDHFDVIIDDGSHEFDHMNIFVREYVAKLSSTGVIVVEDISDIEWASKLFEAIPEDLRKLSTIYDLREVNGRYDDIAIVIDRG